MLQINVLNVTDLASDWRSPRRALKMSWLNIYWLKIVESSHHVLVRMLLC